MESTHRTSRSARRSGPARCALGALAIACALIAAACVGGSGSSGFDLRAVEDRAIDRALDTSQCQPADGLDICVAGGSDSLPATPTVTPTPSSTPTPGTPTPTMVVPGASPTPTPSLPIDGLPSFTPTPTALPEPPNVGTNLAPGNELPCEGGGPIQADGTCSFDFQFVPDNVGPTATYRVALRTLDPPSDWTILPAPSVVGPDGVPGYEQPIEIADAAGNPRTYQIAVLVFLEPPGPLPETVERLGESGAHYAFVTAGLSAEAVTIAVSP